MTVRYDGVVVGANIRAIRRRIGMTAKELALKVGVCNVVISRIENGHYEHGMKYEVVRKYADALGCTVEELTGESSEVINPKYESAESRKIKVLTAVKADVERILERLDQL